MGTLAFIVCVLACFGSIALAWVLPSSLQEPCATALCPDPRSCLSCMPSHAWLCEHKNRCTTTSREDTHTRVSAEVHTQEFLLFGKIQEE